MNQKDDFAVSHIMKNFKDYEDMTTSSQKKVYHQYPPYQCQCEFCQGKEIILKEEPNLDYSMYSDMDKFEASKNSQMKSIHNDITMQQQGEFSVLVQFLMPKAPYKKPPRIYIQDTLFFKNREPYLLLYNQSDDLNLTFINQASKLQKQFITQFFYKRRQDFEVKLKFDELEQQDNKCLSAMDKKYIEIIRKIKSQLQFTLPERQYAHIFFNLGDASQIISYPEFQVQIEKLKTADNGGKIQFIQSCSIDKIKVLTVRYVFEQDSDTELFEIAKDDTNNQFNMPNYYLSQIYQKNKQFLEELIKDQIQFIKYQMFKLCIYAELVHFVRIMRCKMQFIKSPQGHFYLINCFSLFYENIKGIRHSKIFEHFTKNYDKEYQDDLVKQYEQLLIQQKWNEQQKKQKFEKYQNSLLKREDESDKQQLYKQIIKEDCDHLNEKFIINLNKQYDKFDMGEQKALSRKSFHLINQGTDEKDFNELIQIGNNKIEIDNVRLLQKQILFKNFPLKRDQYVQNIEYQIFKKQIEEKNLQYRKNHQKKLGNDDLRPQTQDIERNELLIDQFENLQHNSGGKLNPPKIPNTIDEIKKYKVKNIEIAKEEEYVKYKKRIKIKELYVQKDEIMDIIKHEQTEKHKIFQQFFESTYKQQQNQQKQNFELTPLTFSLQQLQKLQQSQYNNNNNDNQLMPPPQLSNSPSLTPGPNANKKQLQIPMYLSMQYTPQNYEQEDTNLLQTPVHKVQQQIYIQKLPQEQEQKQIQIQESKQWVVQLSKKDQEKQKQISEYQLQKLQCYQHMQKLQKKSFSAHKYNNAQSELSKIHTNLIKNRFGQTQFVYLQDKISMKQFYDKSHKQITRIKQTAKRKDHSMGVTPKKINVNKNVSIDNFQLQNMYSNVKSDRKEQFAKKIEQITSLQIQNQFGE